MSGELRTKEQSLFSNKNYMLLFLGHIVSNLGNGIHQVAVAWFIMSSVTEERSGMYMAIFGTCVLIPYIVFGPFSGVLVDRINRKKIIYGSDFMQGILMLLLALLVYRDFYPLQSLFVITSLCAFFGTFFNPAVDSSVPNVVNEAHLGQANALNELSRQLSWTIGGAIAGILYYRLGIVGVFMVNGLSFIGSGISEMFIQLPSRTPKSTEDKFSLWEDFKVGIAFVKSQKVILKIMIFALTLNFIIQPILQIIFPKTVKFTLEMTAKEFGYLQSLFPVGAVVGMLLISLSTKVQNSYRIVQVALIAQASILIAFGIPIIPSILREVGVMPVFILFCIMAVLLMMFNSLITIPFFTALQRRVPDEYRGRFFALLNTTSAAIVPVGLAFFGVLSDIIIPAKIFIVTGIIAMLFALWMIFTPDLKTFWSRK
ncbi:MFS transporter [Alkaliphilus transvaalensis]|uniref:MFS transporter n=1 Tax=Alkaliphilus transvaalensis TaxID=114628 RepID=UPI00047EF658|nr:MFS transporter [Alkaliphilus transvaalensis]